MNLKNKILYLLSEIMVDNFNISFSDFSTVKRHISKIHTDDNYKTLKTYIDFSSSKFINYLYFSKNETTSNWELCLNTKTKLYGDKLVIDSSTSLEALIDTLFNTNIILYRNFYDMVDYDSITNIENRIILPGLIKKQLSLENISSSEIEEIFTIFKDLDTNSSIQSGFIMSVSGGYGLETPEKLYCSDRQQSNLLGFIITTFESDEIKEEINHLLEKIKCLYPEYHVHINKEWKFPNSAINIVVSKQHDKDLSNL